MKWDNSLTFCHSRVESWRNSGARVYQWPECVNISQTDFLWYWNLTLTKSYIVFVSLLRYILFKYTTPLPSWRCGLTRAMASSFLRFLDHTQRHITVGRTPLDEWSARRRDLYLTTNNTHNRQISMPSVDSNPQPQQASGRRPTH